MLPDVKHNIPGMKLYCYSLQGFVRTMKSLGYKPDDEAKLEDDNVAVISICCTDTLDVEDASWKEYHYFNNKSGSKNILNIEFDDLNPETWNPDFDIEEAADDDFIYDPDDGYGKAYALNPSQTKQIFNFILDNLGKDIYVHCSAGVSRSQAIVRFILDMFPEYNYKTRPDNPPLFPNIHVLRMLKRCYYNNYMLDSSETGLEESPFKKQELKIIEE